ncbi:unnamed protein product [Anisakis simplex]|uniref:Sodium-dependent serotonin transporter (inferred by orthology to a human protein) n=1 Tax=Anisakis simplex TaxID=6269 RepID=A0A158PMT4_ANISI|nr:unnamed protein product [Anisakis simplex]
MKYCLGYQDYELVLSLSMILQNDTMNCDRINEMSDYGTISVPSSPCALNSTSQLNGKVSVEKDATNSNDYIAPKVAECSPVEDCSALSTKSSALIVSAPLADTERDSVDHLSAVIRVGDAAPSSQASRLAALRRRSSVVREKWANKIEFLLAVIGYAVDLGNIWRFPSECYKNGGGAFLIPYLVMLLVGGLPMFYMELALGQFHRSGCISIWSKICPMFKGIGYGICFICTFIACYYNAIIAHAVYIAYDSLQAVVPWKTCNNTWNTDLCTSSLNETLSKSGEKLRTPSEEYFLWVVWVTATAPYIILTILLIRCITLPGASRGIYYYLTPNFSKLLDAKVWSAAATQIFFSLGPGFGVLLALSSYNDFHNNCYRDALVTSVINCGTSFFAGFVIFSTLGYMSVITNRPVSQVVGDHEASLIFIVYPQAIATMSYSSCWSFIFFVMLITLGIDSTFSGIEALITGFCDEYPRILARKREIFVAIVIASYYLGSLPTVTYGGTYVIEFLDEYGVTLSVLFIVMCEMVAVCCFYGIRRFSEDVRQMLGFYPGIYWRFCWTCCPLFIGVSFVFFFDLLNAYCIHFYLAFIVHPFIVSALRANSNKNGVNSKKHLNRSKSAENEPHQIQAIFALTVYDKLISRMRVPSITYPEWSILLGWFLRLTSVMSVPIYAIYYICNTKGTFSQRWQKAIRPQQRPLSRASSAASFDAAESQPSAYVMDCSSAFNHTNTVAHL